MTRMEIIATLCVCLPLIFGAPVDETKQQGVAPRFLLRNGNEDAPYWDYMNSVRYFGGRDGGPRPYRRFDTLTGEAPIGTLKRFDSLSGATFGMQKRNFDEIDRAGFGNFVKKNFDEIDRSGGFGFNKRNFDEIDRQGFGFAKRA